MFGLYVVDAILLLSFLIELHTLDRLTLFGNMVSEAAHAWQQISWVGTLPCMSLLA